MIRFSFLLLAFIFISGAQAQQSLCINWGFDQGGLGFGYHFAENGSVLKRGGTGYFTGQAALFFNLQYRFNNYFAVESGLSVMEYDIGVHDVQYISRNKITADNKSGTGKHTPGWSGASRLYVSPKFALNQHIPFGRRTPGFYLYFTEGLVLNHLTKTDPYVNATTVDNETMTLTTQYKNNFMSSYIESGIHYAAQRYNLYFGLKYTYAGTIMQADYTDVANGVLINSDHAQANGSYVALTARGGMVLWSEKKQTQPKQTTHTDHVTNREPNVESYFLPENRTVKMTRAVVVHASTVTIEVWDHESIDGDVLSLTLNDKPLLENYALTLNKYVLHATLNPGDNIFFMTAVNQGRYKPCTAAITIDDGTNKQTYIMDADFAESDGLMIRYEP